MNASLQAVVVPASGIDVIPGNLKKPQEYVFENGAIEGVLGPDNGNDVQEDENSSLSGSLFTHALCAAIGIPEGIAAMGEAIKEVGGGQRLNGFKVADSIANQTAGNAMKVSDVVSVKGASQVGKTVDREAERKEKDRKWKKN